MDKFLKEEQELELIGKVRKILYKPGCICHSSYMYVQRIKKLQALGDELSVMRCTAALNLVSLDCREVNEILAKKAFSLADKIITFLLNDNRERNKE